MLNKTKKGLVGVSLCQDGDVVDFESIRVKLDELSCFELSLVQLGFLGGTKKIKIYNIRKTVKR